MDGSRQVLTMMPNTSEFTLESIAIQRGDGDFALIVIFPHRIHFKVTLVQQIATIIERS
jgi:hypothetical protein